MVYPRVKRIITNSTDLFMYVQQVLGCRKVYKKEVYDICRRLELAGIRYPFRIQWKRRQSAFHVIDSNGEDAGLICKVNV